MPEFGQGGLVHSKTLLIRRKAAAPHVIHIRSHGGANLIAQTCILPRMPWQDALRQSQQIMDHLNLAVTVGTGTDANRRHAHSLGYQLRQGRWYRLQNDRIGSRLFQHLNIAEKLNGSRRRLALQSVAAELMYRLGGQPDMAHHRHACRDNPMDGFGNSGAAPPA